MINNKLILRRSLVRGFMVLAAALAVKTTLALALLSTGLSRIEALTVLFLTLRLFAVASLSSGCIFWPMLPHGTDIFYFLAVAGYVDTIAARAFLSAYSSIFKALAVKLNASCFFAHTSCFPLLLWSSKIFGGLDGHILAHLDLFWVMDMLNRSWFIGVGLAVVQVHIFDGLDWRDIRFGHNEPHFIGEDILVLHDGMKIIEGGKTIHGKGLYILLPS